ncbi:hypothetical protein CEXT_602151 [Caerostris extrusa]|uniref:Uncharacterized protein n=1 Tax=Caerostris extrusa TaxID=172846 RepID=A0AAV4SWS0_CAEEX|nr:hypothetical protein CEXT_602151 [Caerostris extrusa]
MCYGQRIQKEMHLDPDEARSLNRLGGRDVRSDKGPSVCPGPCYQRSSNGKREIWWGLAVDFDFVLGKKREKCNCSEALTEVGKWSITLKLI